MAGAWETLLFGGPKSTFRDKRLCVDAQLYFGHGGGLLCALIVVGAVNRVGGSVKRKLRCGIFMLSLEVLLP